MSKFSLLEIVEGDMYIISHVSDCVFIVKRIFEFIKFNVVEGARLIINDFDKKIVCVSPNCLVMNGELHAIGLKASKRKEKGSLILELKNSSWALYRSRQFSAKPQSKIQSQKMCTNNW